MSIKKRRVVLFVKRFKLRKRRRIFKELSCLEQTTKKGWKIYADQKCFSFCLFTYDVLACNVWSDKNFYYNNCGFSKYEADDELILKIRREIINQIILKSDLKQGLNGNINALEDTMNLLVCNKYQILMRH